MRRCIVIVIAAYLAICCTKTEAEVIPEPEREKSVPEKVEAKLLDLSGRGWEDLYYDLRIYYDYIIKKGNHHGYGPDGRYYDLNLSFSRDSSLSLTFSVDEQEKLIGSGRLKPVSLSIEACNTEIIAQQVGLDSIMVSTENIGVITPVDFMIDSLATAPLLFDGSRVGFLTLERFEDESYRYGEHIVLHYYGDPRTFSFYGIMDE